MFFFKSWRSYIGIKINILGKTSSFSTPLKSVLRDTVKKTTKNKKLVVNLALNYGSKNEIKNAFIKLQKSRSKISEAKISKNLYKARRVDFIAPANYNQNYPLFNKTCLLLDFMVAKIRYNLQTKD